MALRDLLAVFDVRVNDAPLAAGEARADAYAATLEAVAQQVEALSAEQINAPSVAPADVPEAQAGGVAAVELDTTAAQAEIARLEQAHESLKASILSHGEVDLSTGPAADALAQISSRADELRAQVAASLAAVVPAADEAATAVQGIGAPVPSPVPVTLPKALKETATAARGVTISLEGIGNADVSSPLVGALARVQGRLRSVWDTIKTPPPMGTGPLKAFGAAMGPVTAGLGAFGIALGAQQLVSFGASVVNRAGELTDMGNALRIGTRELQLFDAWLGMSGASAADLPAAVRAMSNALNPLTEESKAAQAAFKELGISQEEQKELGKDNAAAFLRLGGAIGAIENPTKRATVAQAVLGRSALTLLPAFEGGTEAIQEQLGALEEMGILMSDDTVSALDDFGDKLGLAKLQLMNVASKAIVPLIPLLEGMVTGFTRLTGWISRNVGAAGVFRVAFLGGAMVLSRFVGALNLGALTLARAGGWLTRLGQYAMVAARWLFRVALPFLFLEDVFGFLQGKESVLGDIADGLFGVGSAGEMLGMVKDLASGVSDAFGFLWDVLTGNPIDATTLQMTAGISAWMNAIADFQFFFQDVWNQITAWVFQKLGAMTGGIASFLSNIPGLGAAGEALQNTAKGLEQSAAQRSSPETRAALLSDRERKSAELQALQRPAVAGAVPQGAPVINQTNNVNASFTGVAGAPTDIKDAANRVGKAAGDSLARSNAGALRSAGVAR